jgi:hypothetical protein
MSIPSARVAAVVAFIALFASIGPAQVANDTCETAQLIPEGVVQGNNFGAQNDLPDDMCTILDGPFLHDVWYRFEPAEKGWLKATFGCNGADFDTGLFLYQTSCPIHSGEACNDDFCGVKSQLQVMVVPSQPVQIAVAGYSGLGDQGQFALKVTVDRVSPLITAAIKVGQYKMGGFEGPLSTDDAFGEVASLGDFDGDGVPDVAVGAPGYDDGATDAGAVWLLEQSVEGKVLAEHKLSNTVGGLTGTLPAGGAFGTSLAGIGDLNDDGTLDLVVGSPLEDVGSPDAGVIRIIFLRPSGTVQVVSKIGAGLAEFSGLLQAGDRFGAGLAAIGDVDGDGVVDLAVGAEGDDDGAADSGAVWIVFLQPNGSVKANVKLSATAGGFGGLLQTGDSFGTGVGAPGDIDGDGVPDLVVGAPFAGAGDSGAFWTVLLNRDGTAKAAHQIDMPPGFVPAFPATSNQYGAALCGLGDVNEDGAPDLAVGAPRVKHGATNSYFGVVFEVLLNADGTLHEQTVLTDPALGSFFLTERLGRALASAGDIDGDGHDDLLVGNAGTGGIGLNTVDHFMTLFLDLTNAWVTLPDGGLAGENSYAPELRGEGPLTAGSPWSLELAIAQRFSPATFVVGLSTLFAPFKGGVLVPNPNLVLGGFQTNGQGQVELQGLWPAGVPSGANVWVQAFVVDAGAPAGLAASNAVRATTP